MISDKRNNLIFIIVNDLLNHGKLPFLLLISVLVSAVFVVTTTYQTRCLTTEREQISLEKEVLDIEWRNLILEENTLLDYSRVEHIAIKKLHMQHIDSSQENIVLQP
ncbi:Cell division protein FtsL [Candidatus Gullanella endobia]|uniref:Cell division protein FtsL n=1 Tax=Candidatus Gullanella endobia TaxID=1070130 RepID=A0A143WRB2_9ENTR|nr:cell division protein FtsL [Candidatus Gullanella endobia]CUX96336.1 Cell division protein FtsL [Candidatus Gullanella endobia]